MKKLQSLISIILLLNLSLLAQGLNIGSGTTFTLGTSTLSLTGNWRSSGTFIAESGTVIFDGANGSQTITNSSGETFYNLTVNKDADDVKLANNIEVTGTLTCTSGDLDLNGNILNLTGTLSETEGNTVKGETGYITCSSDLNAPSSENPHGIGIEITGSATLGTTTIIRGHTAQSGSGNYGIERYFDINPTNNSSLDASLLFYYDESELNSADESSLMPFQSDNVGDTWLAIPSSSVNTDNNTISFSGITTLSRFTLSSSDQSLPMELSSFSVRAVNRSVLVEWTTESETDNKGFIVERSDDDDNWIQISSYLNNSDLAGQGITSIKTTYKFTDTGIVAGMTYYYRLVDVSTTGEKDIHESLSITLDALPKLTKMDAAYPNPFNPTTHINYQLAQDNVVNISVYDMLGSKVKTLYSGKQFAGSYNVYWNATNEAGIKVPTGLYLINMSSGNIHKMQKVLLMK